MITGTQIRQSLTILNSALAAREIRGEICLFGGAVMVLAFQARQSTKEVDAVFAPTGIIRELVGEIGQEQGWEEDWINDGVKGWLSERQDFVDAGIDLSHLAVMMPVPEYLLAMKCMAARVGQETRDMDDVKFLVRHLAIREPGEALAIVENYDPANRIAGKTRYFVDAAFEEIARESQPITRKNPPDNRAHDPDPH